MVGRKVNGRMRRALLALAAGAVLCLLPATAFGVSFSHPDKLPNSLPKGELAGWEPSVAFSPSGRFAYVSAPFGGENGGVAFWRSTDGGRSWEKGKSLGSILGGGDSDVDVGKDGTVYVADLELITNALCRSTDHGKTFDTGCNTGISTNHTGPESDREWVNPDPNDADTVYFSYHDFVLEAPLVYKSTAGGAPLSFLPCGPVLDPAGEAFTNFIPGGTNQGKLLTAEDGSIYVPILEPTNPATYLDPYNNFYMAIARDGCILSTQFENVKVYSNPKANLANIFPYVVEDGSGGLYALATGISGKAGNHFASLLFTSANHGQDWSPPISVERPGFKASALAAVTGGPSRGDVAVGFYATKTTGNPSSDKNVWRYYVATSEDRGQHFDFTRITRRPIHYGAICTLGLLCVSGRNLLDFSSLDVSPRSGCVYAVFAGDPFNKASHDETPSAPYVSRQNAGCF